MTGLDLDDAWKLKEYKLGEYGYILDVVYFDQDCLS